MNFVSTFKFLILALSAVSTREQLCTFIHLRIAIVKQEFHLQYLLYFILQHITLKQIVINLALLFTLFFHCSNQIMLSLQWRNSFILLCSVIILAWQLQVLDFQNLLEMFKPCCQQLDIVPSHLDGLVAGACFVSTVDSIVY